jgi:hypothetical protein
VPPKTHARLRDELSRIVTWLAQASLQIPDSLLVIAHHRCGFTMSTQATRLLSASQVQANRRFKSLHVSLRRQAPYNSQWYPPKLPTCLVVVYNQMNPDIVAPSLVSGPIITDKISGIYDIREGPDYRRRSLAVFPVWLHGTTAKRGTKTSYRCLSGRRLLVVAAYGGIDAEGDGLAACHSSPAGILVILWHGI